jgi:hypothetical protein
LSFAYLTGSANSLHFASDVESARQSIISAEKAPHSAGKPWFASEETLYQYA